MLEVFKSIKLDKNGKEPLYEQLYSQLANLIKDGTLLPDFRLPAIRKLSEQLQVNPVTVVSAYRLLENNKLAYSKQGSGTFVASVLPIENTYAEAPGIISDELYNQDDYLLISSGQIKINADTINFASATPTADLFPVENFKLVINKVLDQDKGAAFGYQDSRGHYPLREAISVLMQKKHITCSADDIQIISGAQQGIDIISKAFLRQGDSVITESPTYTGAVAVFKSRGAQVIDVEMEEGGPSLNAVEYYMKKYKPKLIYTIPSFQNPTGYSYTNVKRKELLKLAEKYNAYIVEDDYVSDLDFEDRNYMPIKSYDENNRVIFVKSFSKIFMPGLRLGFMVVPANLQNSILEAKHTTDISTSALLQRAFNLYIREGFWTSHFNFMYENYKQRYEKVINALDRFGSDKIKYSKPGGGLNIWLTLPGGLPVNTLLKVCAANNVVFAPGRIFYSDSTSTRFNNIRISFAATCIDQIEEGISKLCASIDTLDNREQQYRNLPIL